MSRSKNNKNRRKDTKKIRNLVFAIFLLLVSVTISYVYFTAQRYNNVMFPGLKIQGVDLSGKTKEESIKILREKYGDAILNKKIIIKAPNRNYTIGYSELNAQYNIIDTVNKASTYGKDLNILSKFKTIKKPVEKQYNLEFSYNHKPLDNVVKEMEKNINKKPKDATIKRAGNGFQTTPDEKGAELESDKLKKEIISKITENPNSDIVINAPIKVLSSKITEDSLKSINSKLTSFSTNFGTSSEGRSTNISIATQSINGKVIMPGDTFSFNEVVGERTKDRGYKEAGVIVNQKLDSGLGGGICQVSSTLYNALLQGNIKTTERVHHTFPSSYVKMGLDATVDWGNIDLKFKNTFKYPIYIEGYTANKNIYFNIYSNSELAKKSYTLTSEVYSTIEPTTKYIDDPNLPVGQTEEVKKPHTGYRVKVYRNVYENGKLVNQELVSNDYYVPINGVIKRGTKK